MFVSTVVNEKLMIREILLLLNVKHALDVGQGKTPVIKIRNLSDGNCKMKHPGEQL